MSARSNSSLQIPKNLIYLESKKTLKKLSFPFNPPAKKSNDFAAGGFIY